MIVVFSNNIVLNAGICSSVLFSMQTLSRAAGVYYSL